MASRHLSRSIAMQTLYEWDFNGRDNRAIDEILNKNLEEFGPGLEDKEFPRELVHGAVDKIEKIDDIIVKSAPEWPLNQIAMVDRNILRLALYELLFGDYAAVPPKVSINEAIELAKSFGGESSGKFVNGVLGTIYREMGEPGKGHSGNSREKPHKEDCVGAIIFRREGEKILWVMVRDIFNYWTFVKGHREEGETPEDAALREVEEEVGLGGKILAQLGQNTYPATTEHGENILRRVTYFLVEATESNITLEQGQGLVDGKWYPMEEVKKTKHYEDTDHIIEAAVKKIQESSK